MPLVCRALPLTVPLDAGAEQPVPCMLSFNAAAATAEQDAPFAPAAVLYLSSGEDLWRLEWSSLEALALRPDLAAWRSSLACRGADIRPSARRIVPGRSGAPAGARAATAGTLPGL